MAIRGTAGRLGRRQVTAGIAASFGLEPPEVPQGSTVGTRCFDQVLQALGEDRSFLASTYRELEQAPTQVGETYDSAKDSSEHVGRTGGGTVTNDGYRKLLRGTPVGQTPQEHSDAVRMLHAPGVRVRERVRTLLLTCAWR